MRFNYSSTVYGLKITDVIEEKGDELITIPLGVCVIGPKAFVDCKSITHVDIPPTVKIICQNAFENCTSLEFVYFSEGLEKIDNWAFFNCNKLKKADLPSSCTYIGDNVFDLCNNLKSVWMGDNVTHVGKKAFYGCRKLKYINLPPKTEKSEYGVPLFYGCKNLVDENGLIVINDVVYGVNGNSSKVIIPSDMRVYDMGIFKSTQIHELIVPYDLALDASLDFAMLANNTALNSICANDMIVIFTRQPFVEDKEKYVVISQDSQINWSNLEHVNKRIIERNLMGNPQLLSQAIKFGLLDNYEMQNDLLQFIEDYMDDELYFEGKSIFLNYMSFPEVSVRRQEVEANHRDMMFRCMDQLASLKNPSAIKSTAIYVDCELTTFGSLDEFWGLVSLCGGEKHDRFSIGQVRVIVITDNKDRAQDIKIFKNSNKIIKYLTESEFNELIGRDI